mgnify:CR=1 FL=1
MRGKRFFGKILWRVARLIPAGAGKTPLRSASSVECSAHPRRCGENFLVLEEFVEEGGSSPQVRGKQQVCTHTACVLRLIPAGAGKTQSLDSSIGCRAAHPRRCGENPSLRIPKRTASGSSPQVRGKLSPQVLAAGKIRLIPAGAGKTHASQPHQKAVPAHPRRCGENP